MGGLAIDMDTVLVESIWEGFGDGEAGWEGDVGESVWRRVVVICSEGGLTQRLDAVETR